MAAAFRPRVGRNTNDFGKLGTPPTHPELLDWLAARLVTEGWSLKNLHRLMVTSATYRQDSNHPTAEQADPANTWFARATVQRMDAGKCATACWRHPVN